MHTKNIMNIYFRPKMSSKEKESASAGGSGTSASAGGSGTSVSAGPSSAKRAKRTGTNPELSDLYVTR